MKLRDLLDAHRGKQFELHEAHLNPQLVRVLRAIGFDRTYVEGRGAHLFDSEGRRYLDLLSGYGVFAVGRNHPRVVEALLEVLESGLPQLVQMDASLLAGLLAERLVARAPAGLERVYFCNSGTEAVEAALKFSRYATRREKFVHCRDGYHGLTYGALSVNGMEHFREGFGPLLPGAVEIPFDDLAALERALAGRDVAAFVVEPILGHGVRVPGDDYLPEAARLCRKYGTLLVADEVQTGLGRTGRFCAVEHWGVEPDLLCFAKALSGGFVPVGATLARRAVFDRVFDRMDRAVVHGSTYSKNNLAMAAGLATLEVIEDEKLVENAERIGSELLGALRPLVGRHELVKEVRGKGAMLGIEFGAPSSLRLRAAWKLLDTASKGLFCQMITVPLFSRHNILCQVAGPEMPVVKFLPSLVMDADDRSWLLGALEDVISDAHRVPGAIWDLGRTLAGHALRAKASRSA